MVRTKGPLLSLEASGSIGKTLIASNWKGRSYTKKLSIPTNPKTAAQVGVRSILRYLTEHWSILTQAEKDTWNELAAITTIPPSAAYIQENLKRWSLGKMPGEEYPVTEASGAPGHTGVTLSSQGRGALTKFSINMFQGPGTFALYHSLTTPWTPNYDNAILVIDAPTESEYSYFHTPLSIGWHYYTCNTGSLNGAIGTPSSVTSIQIT